MTHHAHQSSSLREDLLEKASELRRRGWFEQSKGAIKKWTGKITGRRTAKADGSLGEVKGEPKKHAGEAVESVMER